MNTILISGIEVPADEDWNAVRKRQRLQLEVLRTVAEKFDAIGLRYYLAYGGLIGLMRHGGRMIPWDDDVDLIMPRTDYEAAISVLCNDEHLRCYEFTRDSDFRIKSAKVALECRAKDASAAQFKSCFIDIFAMDKAPSCYLSRCLKFKLRVLLEYIAQYRQGLVLGWRKVVCKIIGLFLPKDVSRLHRVMVRLTNLSWVGRSQWDSGTLVGEMYGAYAERCFIPWGVYEAAAGETAGALFEGIPVHVPCDVQSYLTHIYGDWKKMPPVEKRCPAHCTDDPWFYSELRDKRGL